MLRHAFASPKLAALGRKLGIRRYEVVGVLEHLWYFTATQAPRGDVGRWTDDEIAAGIDWPGDATELVDALVATRWLDRCADHRLLVHDWADHSDATVKRSPIVKNRGFAVLRACDTPAANMRDTCATHDSLSLSPEPVPEPVSGGAGGLPAPQAAPAAKESAAQVPDAKPKKAKRTPETDPPETLTEEQFEELEAWARREMPGEATAVRYHVSMCLDHFRGTRRADWIATCRNWIRRAPQMRRPGAKPPPQRSTSAPSKASHADLIEAAERLKRIEFERRSHGEI